MIKMETILSEEIIKTVYKHEGLRGLATALNNAFCHGNVILEREGFCDQKVLDMIFKAIETFEEAATLNGEYTP